MSLIPIRTPICPELPSRGVSLVLYALLFCLTHLHFSHHKSSSLLESLFYAVPPLATCPYVIFFATGSAYYRVRVRMCVFLISNHYLRRNMGRLWHDSLRPGRRR